jgi:lipopolysaccharide export system protein LptC
LGLALAAAGDKPVDYDFRQAEALNQPQQSAGNTNTWLRNAIAVTVALMVAALAASYWSMKKDVKLLGEVIAAKHEDLTVQQVLSEQAYREKVARARPDLADLIDRIQQARGDILLDTLEFEKGKPVKISAVANSYDSAYTMQKNLESQNKGVISKVLLVQPRLDQKGKVNFSITFHYRNFSQ